MGTAGGRRGVGARTVGGRGAGRRTRKSRDQEVDPSRKNLKGDLVRERDPDPGRRKDQRGLDPGKEAGRVIGRRGQGRGRTKRRVRRRRGREARSRRRRRRTPWTWRSPIHLRGSSTCYP